MAAMQAVSYIFLYICAYSSFLQSQHIKLNRDTQHDHSLS